MSVETPRKGDWMQVASGRPFWPLDPRADEVHLDDIAHGLSMLCRFGGHVKKFYSVAEHSVWCSLIVPPEHALQALMHDATEAYCVDIPRPLKRGLSNYAEIEAAIWTATCERFGLVHDLHPSVKAADNAMCLAEAAQLMTRPEIDWSATGEPADVKVECWSPDDAKQRFLERYAALTAKRPAGMEPPLHSRVRIDQLADVGIFATDNSDYMRLTGTGKDDARLFDVRVSRGAAEALMHEIGGLLHRPLVEAMQQEFMNPTVKQDHHAERREDWAA